MRMSTSSNQPICGLGVGSWMHISLKRYLVVQRVSDTRIWGPCLVTRAVRKSPGCVEQFQFMFQLGKLLAIPSSLSFMVKTLTTSAAPRQETSATCATCAILQWVCPTTRKLPQVMHGLCSFYSQGCWGYLRISCGAHELSPSRSNTAYI